MGGAQQSLVVHAVGGAQATFSAEGGAGSAAYLVQWEGLKQTLVQKEGLSALPLHLVQWEKCPSYNYS